MRSWVDLGLLRLSAVVVVLLSGPALLTGCGGGADTGEGQLAPEDPAKVEARNKTMEDYMNSPEGKKATKGPK